MLRRNFVNSTIAALFCFLGIVPKQNLKAEEKPEEVIFTCGKIKYFVINGEVVRVENERSKSWYLNGVFHRENDLPAIEYANGTKEWYLNGKLHRENDLPAIEFSNGDKYWLLNGELHRENNLPAIEYASGNKAWYLNGKLHRKNNLPAIEFANGKMVNGKWCFS